MGRSIGLTQLIEDILAHEWSDEIELDIMIRIDMFTDIVCE